jgi:hypothetical protein
MQRCHGNAALCEPHLSQSELGNRALRATLLTFVEEDIWVFTPPSCAALAVFTNHYSEPDAITPITSLAPSA